MGGEETLKDMSAQSNENGSHCESVSRKVIFFLDMLMSAIYAHHGFIFHIKSLNRDTQSKLIL